MESSLQVCNAAGFFLWSQGALRALIPHDILICASGQGSRRDLLMRYYSSSRYFEQAHFEAACFGRDALVQTLMREWESSGKPQFLLPGANDADLTRRLDQLELRNLVAHGTRGADPQSGGFYCFARTTLDESERTARLLDLLLPCVHATYCRVIQEESRSAVLVGQGSGVTAREIEILHLIKDGKSTSDIADHLSLSPFTVRNHVKNILRKLNACSRSHAVAQAISQGILAYRIQ